MPPMWRTGEALVVRPGTGDQACRGYFSVRFLELFLSAWGVYFGIFWLLGAPKSSNFDEKTQNAINVQKVRKSDETSLWLFLFWAPFLELKTTFFCDFGSRAHFGVSAEIGAATAIAGIGSGAVPGRSGIDFK